MIYVPGHGNANARLVVVGEAPGAHEERELTPFCGPSGRVVDDCLRYGGSDRSEVYCTNVVKVRPPNNEIERLGELGVTIDQFLPDLWKELDEIKPNCILAFGNTALYALTGLKGIQKYRGSILTNNRTVLPKVVPSIHPASLFHETDGKMKSYRDKAFIQFDINRAIEQSLFREHRPPQRSLNIVRSLHGLTSYFARYEGRKKLSIDIETFKAIPMCIGFAFSKFDAISVPLFDLMSDKNPEGIPLHQMTLIWRFIADVLQNPEYLIIGQNFKFDQGRLDEIGLTCRGPWFDTSLAWHTLYCELPKALEFQTSVLTEEPYYKDDLEEYNPKKDKLNKRLIYNARDAAVTFEVYEAEERQLVELNLLDWFFERMMPKHRFYYDIERRGLLTDSAARKRIDAKYVRYTRWIQNSLKRDLGYDLNVNSPKQVATTLFGDLKCPIRKGTDEETLEMLMLNAVKDDKRRRIIRNILKGRKARKTISTYVRTKLWPDKHCRTVFNICGTESFRTSTSKPKQPVVPEPMGVAFQTMTKHGEVGADLREMYIPRPGFALVEWDGKQAEDWVVAHLANDQQGKALLGKKDFKKNRHGLKDDRHSLTAMMVLGMGFDELTDEDRQLGKKTRHAGNYHMGKRRLSLMAQISEWRAGKCLDRFHEENPLIAAVFWAEIEQALEVNDQVLVSAHGNRRQFFDRWGDDLFKEAYAFIPQCVVSEHTKFAAMRTEKRVPWVEIVLEAHDSFTAEVPIDRLDEVISLGIEEYEQPIDFSLCSLPRGPLVIPCEVQVGKKNWKEMIKVA